MRAVKSVSIDSERRVIITYLDGSTETLYPNCIWCDSEALRQLIKDLLEEKADAITQTVENVTIASFADGADEGVIKKLLVSIEPIQEGTGDPSPENVRPISGRTGLTVYRSGSDTSDPTEFPVTWETEAGTVYDGSLDVVSGKLIVDHAKSVLNGSESWSGNTNEWYTAKNDMARLSDYTLSIKSDKLKTVRVASVSSEDWHITGYVKNSSYPNQNWIYVKLTTDISTSQELKNWLAENPVDYIYPLATPTEIQLTPQEVRTLLGVNNIWSDSGNILELEYTADTKLYISEQQSGTSDTLASNMHAITIPDLQRVTDNTLEETTDEDKEIPEEVKKE